MNSAGWTRPSKSATAAAAEAARGELDIISLGRRVRHLRKAAGLTLDALGAAVGTAPSQLSLVENGKREPKLGMLQNLSKALGVGIE
ncbi:MAG: helix-turn-helix domain-containing protein, partial [Actinomycetota bacterium]|nr:helix-turn-helix domain-containing protein [Actinomycetota bacterium]